MESLNSCINVLQQQVYAQRLELEDAHHGYVEWPSSTTRRIILWRKKRFERLRYAIYTRWEKWKELKNYESTNSLYKNWEKVVETIQRLTSQMQEVQKQMNSCIGGSKGTRQGNRQGWWKRSKFRWGGRQLSLDKTVGSRVWRHTQGSSGRPAPDLGWGSSSKTAPGSLSTGSPAGRTPPHGDGSMYSQANVRVESVLRPSPERCRPWSCTLKRCCGKRMGPWSWSW